EQDGLESEAAGWFSDRRKTEEEEADHAPGLQDDSFLGPKKDERNSADAATDERAPSDGLNKVRDDGKKDSAAVERGEPQGEQARHRPLISDITPVQGEESADEDPTATTVALFGGVHEFRDFENSWANITHKLA